MPQTNNKLSWLMRLPERRKCQSGRTGREWETDLLQIKVLSQGNSPSCGMPKHQEMGSGLEAPNYLYLKGSFVDPINRK
jgi:hypothetical protein